MSKIKIISILLFLLIVNQGCSGKMGSQQNVDIDSIETNSENSVLVDDMLIEGSPESDIAGNDSNSSDFRASAISGLRNDWYAKKWKNGVVPFRFRKGTKQRTKNLFKKAAKEWNKKTNVKLRSSEKSDKYVLVVSDNKPGCWANLGRSDFGNTLINIDKDETICQYKGVFMHEIGHVLGLSHEHQRYDRDKYITVKYKNIASGSQYDFNKLSGKNEEQTKFDFISIMQYPPDTRSKNGEPTLVVKKEFKKYVDRLGEGMLLGKLSKKDIKLINIMYP